MLQLILGRAGYGKTEYVFDKIKHLVDDGEKDIVLITPEQYSFIAERRLLSDLTESKVSCVDNMSFSRLSNEVSRIYGGDDLPVLSNGAKAVVMKKAIDMVQDSLVLFNNTRNNAFVNSMISIYDEMKSCVVSADDILQATKCIDKEILKQKLCDISSIMRAYDSLIFGKYYDNANELSRLYDRLIKSGYFIGKTVFIDGFSGFVKQEYKIIEVIISQAKAVYITFCTDSYYNADKYNLFYYVNSNIAILKDVVKKLGAKMLEPIILNDNKRSRNAELFAVESYFLSNTKQVCQRDLDNIRLYKARGISDECDYVSLQISKLLRQGYRASEIAVICRDLDKYEKELQFSFNKFNIPYFHDERQDISTQPLIMFVSFLLRCVIYSYSSDDIFSLIKTGLTSLDDVQINSLENYTYMWNISGVKKWSNDFKQSTKGFSKEISADDRLDLDLINKSREYIVDRLNSFKKNVTKRSCADICKAIYFTLLDFSCDEGLKKLAIELDNNGKSSLAQEQGRIWDLLMEILDKLAIVGGDEVIDLKQFYSLFNLMITNEDLGSIPIGLDNVQVGSADRIRCNNPRAVFVIGSNEGEFPQSVASAGLLSENDRIVLIHNNFKLYSYGEILNSQEKYFAYMALSAATDKLFVSYRAGADDGEKSIIITELQSIFPNLIENAFCDEITLDVVETSDNAFDILASNYGKNTEFIASLKEYFSNDERYTSRLSAVDSLYQNNDVSITDTKIATNLFHKDMYLSASRIEDYYNCAFRYFCKFGIGAKPRSRAEMDPMQTGTVIHFILEQIIKQVGSKGLTELSDAEITMLVNKYLNDFLTNMMGDSTLFTTRFKYQFMRLSKMLQFVIERLRDEFSVSDFEAKAFELKIGDGSANEPVKSQKISLLNGGSITIKGSIDRVDTYVENGKQYVRVVDYKSGNKTFSMSDIMYGLNLQMFIYLFALCESDCELSGIASGVLYMHSSRSVLNLDRNVDEKELKSQENKDFKMKGVILNDEQNSVIEHMEHDIVRYAKYIPVEYTKASGYKGNIVTLEQLGQIAKKINSLIADMGNNLHSGIINQNPVNDKHHDKTCEFCDYKSVCMNRREIQPRDLDEIDNDAIYEMLKEVDRNA